jgi:hypothetical protein
MRQPISFAMAFSMAAALLLAVTAAISTTELQAADSPQWINIGPGAPGVWANIAVDPAGNVYVGSVGGGVRKFTAADGTWSSASSWLGGTAVYSLAMDASGPDNLYAGAFGGATGTSGVFKSTDGGSTWGLLQGTAGLIPLSLTEDPHMTGVAFAGGFGGNISRTTDAGVTWTTVLLTGGSPVTSIVIDASNSNIVYVSTITDSWKSSNGGALGTWTKMSNLTPRAVWGLAIDPADSNTLYAATGKDGVWRSADGVATWQAAGTLPPVPYSLVVDSAGHTIFAGTSAGVWKTTDSGSTWQPTALSDRMSVSITIGPGEVLWAGTASGPAVSHDLGQSWTDPDPLEGGAQAFGYGITVDPQFGRKIFVSTLGSTALVSIDRGKSWSAVGPTYAAAREARKITVDPTDSKRVYSGSVYSGLFKSVDGGATWSRRDFGSGNVYVWAAAVDPVSPNIVYAATQGEGLFKSDNYGETWTSISVGLPLTINGVTVDPRNHNEIFAATNQGVFRSDTGGQQWANLLPGVPVWNLTIVGGDSPLVYAATKRAGVYRSSDALTAQAPTWSPINNGITNKVLGRAAPVIIDPDNPQVLYVGSEGGGGVFRSLDGGASWSAINSGLSDSSVFGLATDPHRSGTLYVCGPHGVFMISGASE